MHTAFTFDDINRMLTGMDSGLLYNYQGVEAAPGDVTLTREKLNQFKVDPNATGNAYVLPLQITRYIYKH